MLLSWCDSRLPQRRAAFQALRKGALLLYYMLPGPNGGRSPVWDAIGYPGPARAGPRTPPPKAIQPLVVDRDTELDCDVCVVGSGAGGGTAAGVLAAAGLDVVVLEAGDYYDDADFDGGEYEGYGRMYLNGGGAGDHRPERRAARRRLPRRRHGRQLHDLLPHAGRRARGVGRARRARVRGRRVRRAASTPSASASGSTRSTTRPSAREQLLQRGLTELGWHVDSMPRNVRGCDQGACCGYCGYGCRLGAKQSTVKTWLADAHAAGTRDARATRAPSACSWRRGRARGVQARTPTGTA